MDAFRSELSYLAGTVVALSVIIDPFAVIPIYLSLSERFSGADRAHIRKKASFTAFLILGFFAFTGTSLFKIFGITIPAFQIAGGILLLGVGIRQLNSERSRVKDEEEREGLDKDDISIFPLATPLLAGPGAISTVVLYSSNANSLLRTLMLFLAVLLALLASHILITLAPNLYKVLGKTGLNLLTRIMGIILTAISVQFVINGIHSVLKEFGILS